MPTPQVLGLGPTLGFDTVRDLVEGHLLVVEVERRALARGRDAREPLHRFRVATPRLDAVVGLAEHALRPPAFAKARALTSSLPRGTAGHRSADVLEARLLDLLEEAPPGTRDGIEALLEEARRERRKGREAAVGRALDRAAPKRLRAPLLRVLEQGEAAAPGEPLAFPAARVALRARRLGLSVPGEHDLHAFRLEMKSFRYALDALADHPDCAAAELGQAAEEAREVTTLLGQANDAMGLAEGTLRWAARARKRAREEDHIVLDQAGAHLLGIARADADEARDEFLAGWRGARWATLQRSIEGAG